MVELASDSSSGDGGGGGEPTCWICLEGCVARDARAAGPSVAGQAHMQCLVQAAWALEDRSEWLKCPSLCGAGRHQAVLVQLRAVLEQGKEAARGC